jgi:glycosyltransferase involved in cell wall biosynthesis
MSEGVRSQASTPAGSGPLELSIVIPCLNEAETIASCIAKAQRALREHGVAGEIVVADNGSSDGSPEIAERLGARLVRVDKRGYGHALMGGIAAATGKYVVMGDADDSYDFREAPRLLEKLREGYDLVQGCRLPSGGGVIAKGAMPALHRIVGNPFFSALARLWFGCPVHDVYSGLRGFTKDLYARLDLRCTGMEFATEMIIKACLLEARIAEVPITLYPDARTAHPSHLRTFRDGWRTLRFYLMYSPRWLFQIPGWSLILFGFIGYAVALPGLQAFGLAFDAHTLLFASLALILGYQSLLFGVFTKTFAVSEGLLPADARMARLLRFRALEKGLALGLLAMVVGLVLLAGAVNQWRAARFGHLDYARTMRWVIPGVTLTSLGFLTALSSFFVSILRLRRR